MKNKFYLSSFLLFFILNGECSADIVSIRIKFIKMKYKIWDFKKLLFIFILCEPTRSEELCEF